MCFDALARNCVDSGFLVSQKCYPLFLLLATNKDELIINHLEVVGLLFA